MNQSTVPDLTVEFCGIRFPNPLLLGSGGLGENAPTLIRFLDAGAAGVVTRTTRETVDDERKVFPSPHLFVESRRNYLLNAEWGNLAPWEYWIREGLPDLKDKGIVIVSISGRDINDCVDLACKLDQLRLPLFEINISCSHSGLLYGRITDDANHVRALVSRLKKTVKTPIMLKLGWSPVLPEIARIAAAAGADAIATTNSIGPGLDVRLEDGKPQLGIQGGAGGVTGRAIFPIALQCVHSVVEVVDIPVIGVGGISSYREVVKMLMIGARGVQIYTEALLRGPAIFGRILTDLSRFLCERGYRSLEDLRGLSRPYLQTPTNLRPLIPEVVMEKCTGCNVCTAVCTVDAISVNDKAVIDPAACIGCGACFHVCPPAYNAITWPA